MNIIGHDKVKSDILKAIENNSFSHAHIFAGEKGIGKSKLANFIALRLLGIEEVKSHVDIIEWKLEKGKNSIGVKAIRDIIEEANKKPYEGDKKVIIIHNTDKITFQGQNAFLKTIEEPPANVYMLLLCEGLEDVLDTIKSRCQIHKLKPLKKEEVKTIIKHKYQGVEEMKIEAACEFSEGIPGKAEMFIESEDFNIIRDKILGILLNISKGSDEEWIENEDFFESYSKQWEEIINLFINILRDIIIYKEVGEEELIINIDKIREVKDLANVFSANKLNDIINIIDGTRTMLKNNVNLALSFSSMLLNIQEVYNGNSYRS